METKSKKPKFVKLNRFLNYSRRIMIWLFDGGFYVLSLISVIITILYVTKILNFSPTIIASGLSLLGLVIILALQIFDAIDFAEHKPNTFINWIRSFPTLGSKVVTLSGTLEISSSLKARARARPRNDAILEEKIDFLMRHVDVLQNSLDNFDDKLDNLDSTVNKKINNVKVDLDLLNTSIDKKLAEHVVGSFDANIFGVIITICGIVIQVFRG